MIEDPESRAVPGRRVDLGKPDVPSQRKADSTDTERRPPADPRNVEERPKADPERRPAAEKGHGWHQVLKRWHWRWIPSDSAVKVWIVIGGIAALVAGIAAVVALLVSL